MTKNKKESHYLIIMMIRLLNYPDTHCNTHIHSNTHTHTHTHSCARTLANTTNSFSPRFFCIPFCSAILSGKELFNYNSALFVDDDGAIDASEENALAMQTKIGRLGEGSNTVTHN